MSKMRTLVAVGSAVLASSLGVVAPAAADSGHWIYISDAGRARFDGSFLENCDIKVDGRQVRTHLKSYTGAIYYSGWAPSQGCNREGHPSSIVEFRVCAEGIGCSGWHRR